MIELGPPVWIWLKEHRWLCTHGTEKRWIRMEIPVFLFVDLIFLSHCLTRLRARTACRNSKRVFHFVDSRSNVEFPPSGSHWTNNERNAPRRSLDGCSYLGTYICLMTQPLLVYHERAPRSLLILPLRVSFLNRYYNLTVCLVIDRNLPDKRARSVSIVARLWFIARSTHGFIYNSLNYRPNNAVPSGPTDSYYSRSVLPTFFNVKLFPFNAKADENGRIDQLLFLIHAHCRSKIWSTSKSLKKQWLLRVNEYFIRDIVFYSAGTLSNYT